MKTKRPAVVTIAAILLIVLSLFVTTLGVAGQFGLLGQGFGARQFLGRGQFQRRNFNSQGGQPLGTLPQGGFPQGGFPQGGFPQGGITNDPNNQGTTPNFTPNRTAFAGIARLLRIIRPVILAMDIFLLILSIVAVVGLLRGKRWGTILAIVVSVLIILITLPSFVRLFSPLVLGEGVLRILMAIAVIVLLLLPQARKAYAPVEDDLDEL